LEHESRPKGRHYDGELFNSTRLIADQIGIISGFDLRW
jgi:hypothetical protein